MILQYSEFKEVDSNAASLLSKFEKTPGYLHEMPIEDIEKFLVSGGKSNFPNKKRAITHYLKWICNNGVNVVDLNSVQLLNLKVVNTHADDLDFPDWYFYDLETLVKTTIEAVETAQNESTVGSNGHLLEGLKAFFLLSWYGVTIQELSSIRLIDVNKEVIYIPLTQRTIIVDRIVANVIQGYKDTTGYMKNGEFVSYEQDTLFRTTSNKPIVAKNIRNARQAFFKYNNDQRFRQRRIADSGGYFKLVEVEKKIGRDITYKDVDIVNQTLGRNYLTIWNLLESFETYKEFRNSMIDV